MRRKTVQYTQADLNRRAVSLALPKAAAVISERLQVGWNVYSIASEMKASQTAYVFFMSIHANGLSRSAMIYPDGSTQAVTKGTNKFHFNWDNIHDIHSKQIKGE